MTWDTLDGLDRAPVSRRSVWGRRTVVLAVAAIVAAGLAGYLGVRTGTVATSRSGYDLEVVYPTVARAGLDVPWEVHVTKDGGFGAEVELAVTGTYFDIFETQGFNPEPAESTRDGETMYLTFTAPEVDEFVLRYDAYIQPSSQRGASGTVSVLERGAPMATVSFRTRLMP